MIDPTWGATTGGTDYFDVLDFDHFAFVIKGLNDSSPQPAGGYKSDTGINNKDVTVTLAESIERRKQNYNIQHTLGDTIISGLPKRAKVTIENLGPSSSSEQLLVSNDVLSPKYQASENLVIPPFGKRTVAVRFDKSDLLTNKDALITMRFEDKKTEKKVKVTPFFFNTYILGGIGIGIFTLILYAAARKIGRLHLY